MATTPQMTRLLKTSGYIVFAFLIAGALFISRTSFAPHLIFEHVSPLLPSDAHYSALLSILLLEFTGGLVVGVAFGIPLGFFTVARPVTKALWISLGTIIVSVAWWSIVFRSSLMSITPVQIWSMSLVMLVLIGTLCLATATTQKLARHMRPRGRIACGIVALITVLAVYHDMFAMF